MPKHAKIIGNTKQCGKCKVFLPFSDFEKDNTKKCKTSSSCKNCIKRRQNNPEWRDKYRKRRRNYMKKLSLSENNIPRIREQQIKLKYKLSPEEYIQMIDSQYNLCAICGKPEIAVDKRNGKIKALAIDHHHESGRVRGLLCSKCNTGLGMFKDDIELFKAAIKYISNN